MKTINTNKIGIQKQYFLDSGKHIQKIATHPLSSLPFVHGQGRNLCKWSVQPTDDYVHACDIGREYAAHLVQYIKSTHPSNTLALIASDIDFTDEATKGYWVGFFEYLERLIYAQAQRMDVFADLNMLQAVYADLLAKQNFDGSEE